MKIKIISFMVLILLLFTVTACGGSTTTTGTTTSLPTGPPDLVEVTYFYESDACFCLALASEWIETTIPNDYRAQIDSGKMTYASYDTKDPASSDMIAELNATNYGLYITEIKGNASSTRVVGGLWLYTDSSGTNEAVKLKFINLLKSELDRALAGE